VFRRAQHERYTHPFALSLSKGERLAFVSFLWLLILAVAAAPSHILAQQKLRVVATSADLKSLAEAVGGARVEAESLAAPEQDPHTLELKPTQLARVRNAALIIRVGLDHEPWLAKLRLPDTVTVLDASKTVRLIQTETPRLRVERRAHVHAFGNTHYWLDPANAVPVTAAIRDALAKLAPADARLFDRNQSAFADVLAKKADAWKAALAPFRGTKIVVMHDSWSYFAERFDLQIVAAAEPQPGVPPSPAELAALLERMREARVKIVVADPHSNPALVRQIAARSGAQAVTLFPSSHDYVRLFDENVSRLVEALKRAGL
jgi:ABC-type Zn uptake system ZnuABC Zn-binding protein ZnuA